MPSVMVSVQRIEHLDTELLLYEFLQLLVTFILVGFVSIEFGMGFVTKDVVLLLTSVRQHT